MLDFLLIKDKIKVIKRSKGHSLAYLVSQPSLVSEATIATDLLKKHIRDHFNIMMLPDCETRIKRFLGKILKYDILRDELSGAGKYYPKFLLTKDPRGHWTTIDRLLSSDQYTFSSGQFDFNTVSPIKYENMGLVLDYSRKIEDYNGRIKFKSNKEKDKTLDFGLKFHILKTPVIDRNFYLGVELEVARKLSTPMDICKQVLNDLNVNFEKKGISFAFLKADSSIPQHGFEIVSAPATLKYHQDAWDTFFNNSAKHLRSFTLPQCGMHVHVSRATFEDGGNSNFKDPSGHIGRLLNFYNRKDNRPFITNIAGRSPNQYTNYIGKKITTVFKKDEIGERNQSINLRPRDTIEIRIFKGNVKKEGFMKNIEFAHASVEFTRQAGLGMGNSLTLKGKKNQSVEDCEGLSYHEFVKWVQEPAQVATYPYLTKWLKARDIITTKLVKLQDDVNFKDTRKEQPLVSNYLNDVA